MTEKKLIKKDYYKMLLEINGVANNEDLVNFINKEIEMLSKKSNSKNSKRDEEVDNLTNKILKVVVANKQYTATEIANLVGLSSQKIVPVLKIMMSNNQITRTEEGRKVYYTLV